MELRDTITSIIRRYQGNVSVAIKNLKTCETLYIEENRVYPSASTIKLVIMSQLLNEVKDGTRMLSDTIELREEDKIGGDGVLKELMAGHRFTLSELMTLMIIISDNTATNILINLMGMDAVNRRATDLGLDSARLQRMMMDSEARKAGKENLTCARDMERLLELVYSGNNVSAEYSAMMLGILKKQQVTGRLDLYLPIDDEGLILAHKTGDLDRLEHAVGIVYSPNCEYIICVLTNETRTNKDGREIIGEISRSVFEAYS